MKVHFSAPLQDLDKHISIYNCIIEAVKASGHSLVKDWLKDYQDSNTRKTNFTDKEWQVIRDETLDAIQSSDAVIVEASIPAFSMGYISALALARKKPLLILFKNKQQSYILDEGNALKRIAIYDNEQTLAATIQQFLEDVDVDANNLRFNMTLDREIYNFLNWEAVNTGKTKAQIVREVLKERIKRKD